MRACFLSSQCIDVELLRLDKDLLNEKDVAASVRISVFGLRVWEFIRNQQRTLNWRPFLGLKSAEGFDMLSAGA